MHPVDHHELAVVEVRARGGRARDRDDAVALERNDRVLVLGCRAVGKRNRGSPRSFSCELEKGPRHVERQEGGGMGGRKKKTSLALMMMMMMMMMMVVEVLMEEMMRRILMMVVVVTITMMMR